MARWEPDARGRLEQAALELFGERGFESTTVAEIANRAGLTERTFFRHFADKREVLFGGAGPLRKVLVDTITKGAGPQAPIDAATAGLEAVAAQLQQRHEFARKRQAVITANPELQERELIKLASWSAAIADTLRSRGVGEPAASLAAEVAMAIFRTAFERWIDEADGREFAQLIREARGQLTALTANP